MTSTNAAEGTTRPSENRVTAAHDPREKSRTKQSESAACDINNIMKKYALGGEIQHVNRAQAHYGDFSSGQDFTDAYTAIAQAEAGFAELPAHIRDMFGNNPETFLYQLEDPEFRAKLVEAGVLDEEVGPIENQIKSAPVLDEKPEDRSVENAGKASTDTPELPKPDGSVQGGE